VKLFFMERNIKIESDFKTYFDKFPFETQEKILVELDILPDIEIEELLAV
jgi:hypothetical protein